MNQLDLPPGTVLQGRYEVVRSVSRGGMGRVFLARDLHLKGQWRALKQFLPSQSLTPDQRDQAVDMFEREATLLSSLRHANMPGVFDHFIEDGVPYLVMHFVEGETLAEVLEKSQNGVPERDALKWAGQLCDILAYLHMQNPPIIFRDLKPSNIMVDKNGAVQLIDFGIARLFSGHQQKAQDTVIVGTPGYAPPEQYGAQGQTTPRSDVYALGVTLHHLLTGRNPAMSPFVFTPPHLLNPAVSEKTSLAVMTALDNDSERRYASASEFKQALFARETVIVPPISQVVPPPIFAPGGAPPATPYPPPPGAQYPPTPPPPAAPARWMWGPVVGAAVVGGLVLIGVVCVAIVAITQFPNLFPFLSVTSAPATTVALSATFTPPGEATTVSTESPSPV
ncbi:MAG: serine/threonine protein kinase, partial [Chloroflexi bacterium]|nr:serine/threonine protein kinase [Chloroflexota bacterium]